ncbi:MULTISPECIES: 50S ribosomal protein L31 [unclassified Spiroplasma]|uniref:50S ribosomal protein L31 n=1 Tax=unclassified Spiroplasma TaxID=2637901 RepID=UPI0027A0C5EA|nr:MAG: 50S ribosomal protein L31 [Spiroplasma endosymbiont of Drosophila atripex]
MAKASIHPEYFQTKVTCITCSNNFISGSTKGKEIRVDTCSSCHPFYTGKQSFVSAKGRVERFNTKASKQVETKTKTVEINKAKPQNTKTIVLETAKDVLKLTDTKQVKK